MVSSSTKFEFEICTGKLKQGAGVWSSLRDLTDPGRISTGRNIRRYCSVTATRAFPGRERRLPAGGIGGSVRPSVSSPCVRAHISPFGSPFQLPLPSIPFPSLAASLPSSTRTRNRRAPFSLRASASGTTKASAPSSSAEEMAIDHDSPFKELRLKNRRIMVSVPPLLVPPLLVPLSPISFGRIDWPPASSSCSGSRNGRALLAFIIPVITDCFNRRNPRIFGIGGIIRAMAMRKSIPFFFPLEILGCSTFSWFSRWGLRIVCFVRHLIAICSDG